MRVVGPEFWVVRARVETMLSASLRATCCMPDWWALEAKKLTMTRLQHMHNSTCAPCTNSSPTPNKKYYSMIEARKKRAHTQIKSQHVP